MDTILEPVPEQHIAIIEEIVNQLGDEVEFISEDPLEEEYEVKTWVKEKSIIRPSGELSIMEKLVPGVYMVDFHRELGLFCQKIKVNTDDLFTFSNSIIQSLMNELDIFWQKADLYKQNKLLHKRGVLLEGFPGTGKTSIITQLSTKLIAEGGVIFKVQNFRNLNNYVNFINTVFRKIQPDTRIITILEDINQYEEVEDELLDFLDGKTHIDHHVVIATTNNVFTLSDALLRPSRIDLRVEVGLPDLSSRIEYFQFKNVEEKLCLELANQTNGCSLADLKEVFISIFLLGYSTKNALTKVLSPREKVDYTTLSKGSKKMGL